MPETLTIIRSLPDQAAARAGGLRIVELPMTAEDRRRVRRRLDAPDGAAFALELPTGTILRPGQVIHALDDRAYVVTAAPEEVLVVRPRDLAEAARVGHLIGNLHRDIDLHARDVVVLWDETLSERLRRLGVPAERARRPFHGSPPGEHSH
jgi:urease accessory protein